MRKGLIKPDSISFLVAWSTGTGKEKEVVKQDEVNFKVPQVPKLKKKRGPIILQFNPEPNIRVKLYGEKVELTNIEYNFLRSLAETPGEIVDGNALYLDLYGEYSDISPDELYVTKSRLLKKLQEQFGEKRVPFSFIYLKPREGFILNLFPWQVQIR